MCSQLVHQSILELLDCVFDEFEALSLLSAAFQISMNGWMNEWNVYWVILYYKLKTRKLPKWAIPNIQIPTPFRIIFGLHSRSDQLYNAYCNTRSIRTLTCTVVIPVKSVFAEIDQYALRPPPPLTFPPPLHTSVCSFSPSTSMTQVWGEESRGPVSIPVVINVSWPDRRWCMFQALKIAAWVKCSSVALLPDTAEPSETWGPGVALRRVFGAHLIWQKI